MECGQGVAGATQLSSSHSSAIPSGPDTDWNYWFGTVKKGAKTGKDNGFSVLFDIESFDYGYYDEGSEGLKVRDNWIVVREGSIFICNLMDKSIQWVGGVQRVH